MRFPVLAVCLGLSTLSAFAQTTPPPVSTPALLAVQNDVTQVVTRVKPSVVTVVCEKPSSAAKDVDDGDGPPMPPTDPTTPLSSLGTGWVFRADGLIITNYHVVRDATSIRVLFNADSEDVERVAARVIGYDPDSDLAVLKVNRTNLPVLELADSDVVQTGQWAIAVGAPFEQPQSVTLGVLSATGRHLDKNGTPSTIAYLQTDASINPGNSGGPLLDLNGRVVGLNTAILSPSRGSAGIGFSIPANTIKRLLPVLVAGKQVKRGFVGVQYTRLAPSVAREFGLDGGLQIGALAQKKGASIGPANDAGVRAGDIIFGVDGRSISTTEEFRGLIGTKAPGDKITLNIARPDFTGTTNVQKLAFPLVLGERTVVMGEDGGNFSIPTDTPITGSGLSVSDAKSLTDKQKTDFKLKGTESGAVVTDIVPASPADEADLVAGLRIVRARQSGKWTDIASAGDWKAFEKRSSPGTHLLLQLRDPNDVTVFRLMVLPAK
ncbi:periplasmic pH-dependent serine endoprotease DegQ [Abditibacteriota bacterium]|nr:periplasmic pH-dependent serine endoprotease DegQ [Abditibacteriota bacterium]